MADEPEKGTPTQDDIDKMRAALEKANAEAKKYRLDAKAKDDELAELRKAADSSKSEMDQVREQIARLNARAEKAEREALVAKVAQAKKLPAALASRLSGSTQEELEADADSLIEALGLSDESERDKSQQDEKSKPGGRPKEALKPGASNEDDDAEVSAEQAGKIAEQILERKTL